MGLEDSFSDSELSSWSPKSLRSRWDVVTGLEAGDEGRDDERGRFLGVSGGFGLVPGSGWECLGVAGSAWEWLGVAWVAWVAALAARWITERWWDLRCLEDSCLGWKMGAWPGGKRGTMGRVGRGAGAPGRLGMEVGSGVVE